MPEKKIVENIRKGIPGKQSFSKVLNDIDYLIRVDDTGQYSLVLSEIAVINNKADENIDFATFRQKAELLEDKLSSFMESPKLIEMDQKEICAQYRSSTPEKGEDGAVKYYELIFSMGKKINFNRIENKKGEKKPISMVIPDECLTSLLSDITEVLKIQGKS